MKKNLLILLFALFVFNYSIAADYYFTGVVNNSWNNAANWTIGYHGSVAADLPSDTDNVYIGDTSANFLIDLSSNCTINNLTLSGNGEINISTSNGKKIFVLGNFSNENNNSNTLIKNAIVFSGASEQLVTGSYEVKIDTLIINKFNGSVTLTNQLSIYKKLILIDGFINSDSINILTIKSGGKVTNASDSSFIEGPVAKLGNTSFTFPIGRNGIYNPITISAPTSTTDKFVAEYFDTKSNTTNLDSQFTYIDTCQFWRLRHLAGSSNVNVKMNIDNPCFHIPSINYIGVAKDSSGNTDEWVSAGNTTILTPSTDTLIATLTAHSSWGDITLGKTNPLVVAFAGNDTAICFGESVTLGGAPTGKKGTGALKYKWSPSTGLSNATIENPVATPTETTTYYVVVTDSISEYTKDAVVVIVYPQLVIDAGKTVNLCQYMEIEAGGDPTASGGAAPYNYLWKNEGGDTVTYKSNPTYIADTSRIFYLTVTDSNYCTAVDTFILITNPPLILSASPDTMLYRNETVQLNSTVSGGTAPFNYIWEPSLYLDDSTISNPTCTPLSSMQYQLTVVDSFGCSDEAFANIDFQLINLGSLSSFAAFAVDSISAGDSSIAIGDVGARFIDTTNIAISGTLHTDTTELNSLKAELENIISGVDELRADTINYDLSNITLTSGIYRIDTSAFLNGILTLEGNDSSYFIFDIDGDWSIADTSKIIHPTVADDKVFFSINGNLILGDSLILNCVFCSGASISGGGFKGNAVMLSNSNISFNSSALKLESIESPHMIPCEITVALPLTLPNSSLIKDGYQLVFNDEFQTGSPWDVASGGRWYSWDSGGDIDINHNHYTNPPQYLSKIILYDDVNGLGNDAFLPHNNLLLRLLQNPTLVTINSETYEFFDPLISTQNKFYHGYFEIKAKMPSQTGTWPAFWTYTMEDCDNHREIDFFDNMLERKQFPLGEVWHEYDCITGNSGKVVCPVNLNGVPVNLSQKFHIYSGYWDNENVVFKIDGEEITSLPVGFPDMRMNLLLNNAMFYRSWDLDSRNVVKGYTGLSSPGTRDFKIAYARVWQKTGNVFDSYILETCNYTKINNLVFPVQPGAYSHYRIETSIEPNTTYAWTSSDPIHLVLYDINQQEARCYFHGTQAGNYTITLNASRNGGTNGLPAINETHEINITITSNSLTPITPSNLHYELIEGTCTYRFCVDEVQNATDYLWDFGTGTFPLSTPGPCTTRDNFENSFLDGVNYNIKVKAHNCLCEGSNNSAVSSSFANFSGITATLIPDVPNITHQQIANSCEYEFCIAPISNSDGYMWSINYGPFVSGNSLCKTVNGQPLSNYHVEVKAYNECGVSNADVDNGYFPSGCFVRIENDSSLITKSFKSDLIKVFPSPSTGSLWIVNNSNSKTIAFIKSTSGVLISKFKLEANEKRELINLQQGILIIEVFNEEDFSLICRSLVPVIKIQ